MSGSNRRSLIGRGEPARELLVVRVQAADVGRTSTVDAASPSGAASNAAKRVPSPDSMTS